MDITMRKVADLVPYEKNAKMHNETQIKNVAESIKQFGFVQPVVVDKDNVIVIGHCRTEAAKLLGMDEVPCVSVDDLTDEQVKALRIVGNKANESPWDDPLLLQEIETLDLSAFDFDFGEVLDEIEEEAEPEVKPEVDFTEILGEENNYIVLKFNTDVDWINAQTVFGIKPAKALSTRKDGKITDKMERIGTGRVIDGAEAINRILGVNL